MKGGFVKFMPVLIAAAVLTFIGLLQALPRVFPKADLFQRLEWITFDWRVRQAAKHPVEPAVKLGIVALQESSLTILNRTEGVFWPLPRNYVAHVIEELSLQGAKAVAMDMFFIDRHLPYAEHRENLPGRTNVSADEVFAYHLARAGNVVLAVSQNNQGGHAVPSPPAELFRTNARVGMAVGLSDPDGVRRRVPVFVDDAQLGRVWHIGVELAAKVLKLDLTNAVIEPNRITLRGEGGTIRAIPVIEGRDVEGKPAQFLLVDWSHPVERIMPVYARTSFIGQEFLPLLETNRLRHRGAKISPDWQDRVVVIGSTGAGNNVADIGTTPLGASQPLFTMIWNVTDSVLAERYIRSCTYGEELALVLLMSLLAAVLSWKLRVGWASSALLVVAAAYLWLSFGLYTRHRIWLPIVLPLAGALAMTHVSMVSYRMFLERLERRRVHSAFGKIVSPNVINQLLLEKTFAFGGSRRELTVLFADVRGFTQFTDATQARAQKRILQEKLSTAAAKHLLDDTARETMEIVNLYLTTIVDAVKQQDGTLDKYIGDCVMAFWGAPVADERHSANAVRAAIAAQRALHALNEKRVAQNRLIEADNDSRAEVGGLPRPTLPILTMGTGINTGPMTVGFMGSDAHLSNYTVFGHEVSVASRLEGVAGSGRIIISEATFNELTRVEPESAKLCQELPHVSVKGIANTVKIYEVQWRRGG